MKTNLTNYARPHFLLINDAHPQDKGVADNLFLLRVQLTIADVLVESYGRYFTTLKNVLIASG